MLDSINSSRKFQHQYFSFVSPYQASIELKQNNTSYHPELTNPSDHFSNYSSSLKKSLNLGIYGSDFAYMILFNDHKRISNCLKAMKTLALELNLEDAMDKSIMERVEDNAEKPDSVLRLISLLYYDTDVYLKNNMRQDIALLIVTGGWVESMYLLCSEYKLTKNEQFYIYISTQKQTLDNLISQLSVFYEKDAEISQIIDLLVDLAYEYDAISYESKITDSTTHFTKGMIQIHNKTTVQNDSKSIDNIIEKVGELRQHIVQ